MLFVTAALGGIAMPLADLNRGLDETTGAERDAVAGDPVRFELRTVDAAGPANPWTKIAGDLDGDGRDDLIVGGQKGPLVWYRWPDFKKHVIADSGWSTVSGAVGDVDGDGDLDVLLGGSVWFENPGQLRSDPDQGWTRHVIAEDPTHDIAVGDFNGDGRLDVVTRNQSEFGANSGNRIRIWLHQTNGPWQGAELECPQGEGLAVADLDRDGDPDIVIGGTWFETIREVGQVRWQAHGFAEFHRNATVAVADFNGDGWPDVALAPSELAGQHSRLSWFEAPENPRVGPWREHRLADPIEAVVHSLAAADFDRDGRMDIAFAEMHQGADPDEVGVFLNRGAIHSWEKVVVSTTGSHGLHILDADGDGAPDLFGANWSGPRQTVELWRQRTRPAAEAGCDGTAATALAGLPRLRVSDNRRFLVTAEGRPFFWLADTAWWIRQLPPPLVKHYLATRAQQGFNVIQIHPGLAVTNHAGAFPFLNNTPESPNELFWHELDRVVAEARTHQLYVALVPMWGDEYGRAFGTNAGRAFAFGQWVGRRYAAESHVVWMVSGEYDAINGFKLPINAAQKNLLIAAARGLKDAHGGTQLMTIHPGVARTSSTDFHAEPWLDFNLLQSGHLIDSTAHRLLENHTLIVNDYARQPIKPVLDGEPIYEDTPDAVWIVKRVDGPRAGADAVRRKAYWSVFSGACGHTYGHNDVYGFFTPAFPGQVLSLQTRPSGPGQRGEWREALQAPGATQMQHLRRLIESRPWLTQVPDPSLLATSEKSPLDHLAALRGEGYALIYAPTGKPFRVRLDTLKGREVQAWWFDPRAGESQAAGRFARAGEREFTPPGQPRAGNDWVLALDDPSRQLPAPGSARFDPSQEETKALPSPAPVRPAERESAVRAPAPGPLRVLPSNPRYFTDDGRRAVYLTGAHTWDNLQDMGEAGVPAAFDFNAYLDFLAKHDHNFIRLWRWELVSWDTSANDTKTARHLVAAPHPWARTGPGQALDGKPRFNLDQFDDAYFQRLRSRVAAARDRGIYVAVMLFEGWGVQHVTDAWKAHPFHPDNNANGLDGDADGDGRGLEVHTLRVPAVTKVQEAYARKVIDTVNDLDSVLYEIANESGAYSTDWQEHFIQFIHDYEAGKPKQHPVGMTFQYSRDAKQRGSNPNLFRSTADWISPNSDAGPFNYRTHPPPADGRKVILTDTDHLWGIGGDVAWVWKSFLRGLNPLFMDPYKQEVLPGGADSKWEPVRRAMGVARRLADRVNLAAMTPRGELASSGYCLANPANEYLVYVPEGDEVKVDLSGAAGEFQVEWIHAVEDRRTLAGSASGSATRTFKAPDSGGAVLHLRSRR